MPGKLRERLSFANVVSVLALVLALGLGSAWAATELTRNEVKSRHIKDRGVKTKDLANNAVTSPKVADASLRGEDFAPGQLPTGPRGPQGEPGTSTGPGRSSGGGSCDPVSTTFLDCAAVTVDLPASARLLLIGRATGHAQATEGGQGTCRIGSTSGPFPESTVSLFLQIPVTDAVSPAVVTNALPPGEHSFKIECNQTDTDREINFDEAGIVAVAISPG